MLQRMQIRAKGHLVIEPLNYSHSVTALVNASHRSISTLRVRWSCPWETWVLGCESVRVDGRWQPGLQMWMHFVRAHALSFWWFLKVPSNITGISILIKHLHTNAYCLTSDEWALQTNAKQLLTWAESSSHACILFIFSYLRSGTQAKVTCLSHLAAGHELLMSLPKSSGVWKRSASLLWLYSFSAERQGCPGRLT